MDTKSFEQPVVEQGKSRLPAGSTLQMANGVHVPHPNAEVNLPGRGDPRLGNTDAVTEYVKVEHQSVSKSEDDDKTVQVPVATLHQKPLAEEVKPKVVTTSNVTEKVADLPDSPNGEHVAVEAETLHKTE